jgi:Dyp-type peroxidase family
MNRIQHTQSEQPLDLSTSEVDSTDPRFRAMLVDLQANIIKGHGRNFAHHIFLKLDPLKLQQAKEWISQFANARATSALALEESRHAHKESGADGGPVFTLSLSAKGYTALGFQPDQFPLEKETDANKIVQDAAAFPLGAKSNAAKLGDGDPAKDWEAPFREEIHLLILVADRSAGTARKLAAQLVEEAATFSEVLLDQKGHVLNIQLDEDQASEHIGIEHFGYADGIRQPLFLKDEIAGQPATDLWNDQEPLNLVLVRDQMGTSVNSFGSFLVFRKLEQDVEGFLAAGEASLPPVRNQNGSINDELSSAMMVGRYRNGTAVVNSAGVEQTVSRQSDVSNNFDYSTDPPPPPGDVPSYSSKCPFFAHIRITNPRSDIKVVPPAFVHSVRMARRGMPYQDISRFGSGKEDAVEVTRKELKEHRPSKGVGLLFMSYQAHIGKQFEFIQNNWANHGHIAGRNVGPDGIIGVESPLPKGLPFKPQTPDRLTRRLPEQWGQPVSPDAPGITFGNFVRNKGGEYFFTPSISFLRSLSGQQPPGAL